MCAQLAVLLNGNRAGLLDHERGELFLTYDETWQEDEGSYPLSLSMPLAQRQHADAVVRPYLEGLLPDNDEILQKWGQRFGVSPRNPFSLLQHVGEDVAGAAQFVDPEHLTEAIHREGDIEWLEPSQIAERLRGCAKTIAPGDEVEISATSALLEPNPKRRCT